MNDLIVNGKQNFMGKEIPVVLGGFGEKKKCICDKTIAEIHSMETKHIRERINQNIKRFKENIDFIDLKQRVGQTGTLELLQNLGYAKQSITQAEHIYLLSERGYAKLIKIMDTDLAWEIHDKLIDEYFELRERFGERIENDKPSLESVNRAADILKDAYQVAGTDERYLALLVGSVYKECGMGFSLPPVKMDVDKLYDQTMIANELGIVSASGNPHSQAVGAIIDMLDISDDDKIATPYTNHGHSGVSVQYKENVVDMVRKWITDNGHPKTIQSENKNYKVAYR